MADGPRLAIVIPARNEASRLPAVLQRLPSTLVGVGSIHVVVVDDGSSDGTAAAAKASGALVVRHATNLGKGGALLTGCDAAVRLGAEVIVAMDADGQHIPADIPALIEPIIAGEADVVLGTRPLTADMPWTFRTGNRVLGEAMRLLFGIRIADTQCGFRAIRTAAFPSLRWEARDYAVESEMLVRMARARLRWREVPVSTIYHDRYKGTQPSDGLRILRQLVLWRLGA